MRLAVETEGSFDLVKLLDFRDARFFDLAAGAQPTCRGIVYDTPPTCRPNRPGAARDQRSDIYSLGAVFYEMVTGTVLFAANRCPTSSRDTSR